LKGHSPCGNATSTDTVDITTFSDLALGAALLEATPDHAKVVAFASDYLDALHAA